MDAEPVWVVQRWIRGTYGDDDHTIVVAVCSTAERAYEIATRHDTVMAFPLDVATVLPLGSGSSG